MTPMKTRCPHCQALLAINTPGPKPTECNCPKCGTRFLPAPADGASAKKSSGSSCLILGAILLFLVGLPALCLIGGGIWWFTSRGKTPDDHQLVSNPPPRTEPPEKKTTSNEPTKTPKTELPKTELPKTEPPKPLEKSLIPFDAIAKRDRLLEVKSVRVKGKLRELKPPKTKEITIAYETVKRLKYQEAVKKGEYFAFFFRDSGWEKKDGDTKPLQGNELAYLQNLNYVLTLSSLLPFLEDGFEVTKGNKRDIKGTPCYGLTVKREGRPPVNLYFEQGADLLLKADFLSPSRTGENSEFIECYFSNYIVSKEVKHWTRQELWRDEKAISEFNVSEFEPLLEAYDLLFTAPGLEKQIEQAAAEYAVKEKQNQVQQALKTLGPGDGSDFARLVSGLGGLPPSRARCRTALLAQAELRRGKQVDPLVPADVPSLVSLLKTKNDGEVHAVAIEGTAALGPKGEPAVAAMLELARANPDPRLQTAVCVALKPVGVKNNDVLGFLEKHADHADGGVRDAAALTLMQLGPDRIPFNRVIDLMSGPSAEIRTAAREVLKKKVATVTVKDLPLLRQGLKNQSRDVCLVLIEAIGSLKEEAKDAAPDLTALLGSADPEIAQRSALALEDMGKLVESARSSSDARILSVALDAMKTKKAKSDEALAVYEKHLDHVNADVKNLAALAILDLGPDRLKLDRVAELMARSDDKVRAAATKVLRERLAAVTAKDLPGLRQGLKNPTKDVRIAFIDAIALLKEDGKDAVPDLLTLLAEKEKEVAVPVCRALEAIGKVPPTAIAALVKNVEKADSAIQVASTLALVKLDPDNAVLKDKGVNVLVDNLKPDIKNLEAFLAKPLQDRSASALIDLGEPAVEPIMKRLLQDNSPTIGFDKQDTKATAIRFTAYEILRELAKKARASGDQTLIKALKKHESRLQFTWEPAESKLVLAKRQFGATPETLKLYTRAAQSADLAYRAVLVLRAK